MRWTIKRRLNAIVALTVGAMLVMTVVDVMGARVVERHLSAIERAYLPQLELEAQAEADFIALVRTLQEATNAQDEERLNAAPAQKDALLRLIDEAPAGMDRRAIADAKAQVELWFALAMSVSRRLMRNETGEQLVIDIEQMQTLQRAARQALIQALSLDRARLGEAFTEVANTERMSWLARVLSRLALALATVALGASLSRRLLDRVREIEEGFERFGRGEFDRPVPLTGNDELTEISEQANRMASNLKQVDEQLKARQAELERTNRELEAFSYSVSHDLRAPLRSIDGFSKALIEDYGEAIPPAGHGYLNRVRAATQRMAQLIDDMLQLSRIGRAELQLTEVDLTALARSVVETLGDTPDARRAEVRVAEGLTARADARLIRVVFENLLSNAYKFTGKESAPLIEVGAAGRTDEGPVFYVRDNGIGFDEAYMGKLFTPFHRLHSEKDFPGTGVGLATVQRVVHKHGGRVWAQAAVGQGATFFFSLTGET